MLQWQISRRQENYWDCLMSIVTQSFVPHVFLSDNASTLTAQHSRVLGTRCKYVIIKRQSSSKKNVNSKECVLSVHCVCMRADLGFLASVIHMRSMLQASTGMWGYSSDVTGFPGFPLVRRTSMISWRLVSHLIGSPNRMTAAGRDNSRSKRQPSTFI